MFWWVLSRANDSVSIEEDERMFRRRRTVDEGAVAEDEVAQRRTAVERPPWSPAQFIALVIGIIFVVVGGIALANTGIHSNAMDTVRTDGQIGRASCRERV